MGAAHDGQTAGNRRTGDPQVGEVLGEIAAAVTYLETLSQRLHVGVLPGERDVAAIPPSTLSALRRSCQRVTRHTDLALEAMSPRRAAEVRHAAAQVRDVERLRFRGRSR